MSGLSIELIVIIALNAVFSIQGFSNGNLFNRFKFNPVAIGKAKQIDRLLTSGFLHVDFTHLIFNMLTLYFFAPVVQNFFGSLVFVCIYIGAIIGGNLLTLYFHRADANYNAVGASGGVSGVLFAAIAIYPTMTLGIMFVIPMPAWLFAILYLGYSIYGMKNHLGNLGHGAHLGGAAIGLITALALNPNLLTGSNRIYVLLMLLPILVLAVLLFREKKV